MNIKSAVSNPESNPAAILWAEFQRIKQKNPSFSLRAFARQLKVPPGRLSQYFSGKRAISPRVAKELVKSLDFTPEEAEKFCRVTAVAKAAKKADPAVADEREYISLSPEQASLLADWYYFAILNSFKMRDFRADPEWFSRRLGIDPAKVIQALESLEKVGLVQKSGNSLRRTPKKILFKDGLDSEVLRDWHERILKKAIEVVREGGSQSRQDFSHTTIAVDPSRIAEAKEMIMAFRRKMSRHFDSGSKSEVYSLNIQFLPLTKE
jgi:uncharacterized protein (TIGR02147 family)